MASPEELDDYEVIPKSLDKLTQLLFTKLT